MVEWLNANQWLDTIEVTDKPSDNYYHFFDNRIMPPHVDAELAKARHKVKEKRSLLRFRTDRKDGGENGRG